MDGAPSVRTAAVLRVGSSVSLVSFVAGLVLAVVHPGPSLAVVPLESLLAGLLALAPAAWLTAGVVGLIVTPPLALLATAGEFLRVDARSVALALGLVALLAVSVVLAGLR